MSSSGHLMTTAQNKKAKLKENLYSPLCEASIRYPGSSGIAFGRGSGLIRSAVQQRAAKCGVVSQTLRAHRRIANSGWHRCVHRSALQITTSRRTLCCRSSAGRTRHYSECQSVRLSSHTSVRSHNRNTDRPAHNKWSDNNNRHHTPSHKALPHIQP